VSANSRDFGSWIVRAALVLLIISSCIRFFGDSARSDTAATWILIVASIVCLTGVAVTAATRPNRRAED